MILISFSVLLLLLAAAVHYDEDLMHNIKKDFWYTDYTVELIHRYVVMELSAQLFYELHIISLYTKPP